MVVLHILLGVVVAAHQHKLETGEVDSAANHEVFLGVVGARHGISLSLTLHEATLNAAGVLVASLVHQDSVITAVEAHNEGTGLIIRFGAHELRVETKYVHILFKHLFHVELWWFGL